MLYRTFTSLISTSPSLSKSIVCQKKSKLCWTIVLIEGISGDTWCLYDLLLFLFSCPHVGEIRRTVSILSWRRGVCRLVDSNRPTINWKKRIQTIRLFLTYYVVLVNLNYICWLSMWTNYVTGTFATISSYLRRMNCSVDCFWT